MFRIRSVLIGGLIAFSLFSCNSMNASKVELIESVSLVNDKPKPSDNQNLILKDIQKKNSLLYQYLLRIGLILDEDIREITCLNLSNVMGLDSLEGLEYFVNLKKLKLSVRLMKKMFSGELKIPQNLRRVTIFSPSPGASELYQA